MKNQKLILSLVFLMLLFLTGCSRGDGKNSDEMDALEKIIAAQREKGATVSEDINNTDQYTWSKDGHLTELKWDVEGSTRKKINLAGELSLSSFPQLKSVDCSNNKLKKLEMSGCKMIKKLNVELTEIESLDLHDMKELETLSCSYAPLKSIDLSNCSRLKSLDCGNTDIIKLDLKNNPELISINCESCGLDYLDVSHNKKLEELDCDHNKIASLDLTNNRKLKSLDCEHNKLTSLDFCNNPNLFALFCNDNELVSLEVSQNEKLQYFICSNNKLNHLKLSPKVNAEDFLYTDNPLPLSDIYALIVPSSKEKKDMDSEKAAEKMKDYMNYTEEKWKFPKKSSSSLKNGVRVTPYFTFSKDRKCLLEIEIFHPESEFGKKYNDIDGDAIMDSEYLGDFAETMQELEDMHTIVSYQFSNSKGDVFTNKEKNISSISGAEKYTYNSYAFMDGRDNSKTYSRYKGNLKKLNKVFSDQGTIKLTLKYKKGSYTYKLNKYQIQEMRLKLDFCKEGQSYIR